MPRPRVLVLDHTAQEGGAELALLRLVHVLHEPGDFDVRVLLFGHGPLQARLISAGVPAAVLALDEHVATMARDTAARGAARSAASAAAFVPRLVRAIRGSGADLVVANSLKSAVFASIACPLAGRRWVWHLHDRLAPDYLPGAPRTAMRWLAALGPRSVVANSLATLETLPAAARRKAVVAYPGLSPDAFEVDTRAERDGTPVIGIVGRVSPTKGQREFLQAAAVVALGHPDVRFSVVGGALFGEHDYESQLQGLADALGIADRVEFTGWVPDAAARLSSLSVLVHASPVPEPFGQVIVEAMATGVPVVATAAGGVPGILDPDGEASALTGGAPDATAGWRTTANGVLVRPGDPDALAAAISYVLDDRRAADARAQAARTAAGSRFTITRTASVVSAAWNGALPARLRVR